MVAREWRIRVNANNQPLRDNENVQDATCSDVQQEKGNTPLTSLSLLERARSQDQDAWKRLVELYEPLVQRWCGQDGLTTTDAADVTQEVFMAVAKSLDRFERRMSGSFRCWLRAITNSKIIDLRRRHAQQQAEGGSDAQRLFEQVTVAETPPTSSSSNTDEETGMLYRRAMELIRRDFSEDTCTAFLQTVVERRSAVDVAADLGMTPNAVRLAKARVLQRLRMEFADLIEEQAE